MALPHRMDFEAFILIGGRSSRLGTDKAFVELGGETLLSRMSATLSAAFGEIDITLVAANDEQFGSTLIPFSRPVVFDLKPGFRAWSGLHAALAYARKTWIFVAACDLPNVSAEMLRYLAGFLNDDIDAVVPEQSDGRIQPLCAFYRAQSVLKAVEEKFTERNTLPPLTELFENVQTRTVSFAEYSDMQNADSFFHNINTPADLQLLKGHNLY